MHCALNKDSKNRYYFRNFDTLFGKIEGVKIPRTRNKKFYPSFLEPYKRTTFDLDEIVLSMYQGGCSTRDIVRTLDNLLGTKYSPKWVSKITDDILSEIEGYHSRRFEKWYPILFIDGTYLRLKRGSVSKYPEMISSWERDLPDLLTYLKYPSLMRPYIYTTNPIESFNSKLKKVTKNRGVFPTEESLFKLLYLAIDDISKKWNGRIKDWSKIYPQLYIFFQERVDRFTNG